MQSQSQREVEDCEMLKSVLEEVKGAISECLNPTQCNWVGFKRKTICMKQKMLPLKVLILEDVL